MGLGTTVNVCFSLKNFILSIWADNNIIFLGCSFFQNKNETEALQASLIFNKLMLANMEDSEHKNTFHPSIPRQPF